MVADSKQVPKAIGKYKILSRIGRGGMAELFLGCVTGEGGFTNLVAVKRILPQRAAEPTFVKMFMDEARLSADLHHPNIAQIYEFGRVDDTYFIAMEYVRGMSLLRLQQYFTAEQRLPPLPMTAFIMSNVCGALEYAHSRCGHDGQPMNIIHRDVSPSNILCGMEGDVKLIDFGIAKAEQRLYETVGSGLKGKIAYMSPEQAFGPSIDHRADIFGAGVVLFELLTGTNPFDQGSNDIGTLERIRQCKIAPPSSLAGNLPPELEQICLRALARLPQNRYATAGEMQAELEAFCFELHYGRRQLAEWMKAEFPDESAHTSSLLIKLPDLETNVEPRPRAPAPKQRTPVIAEATAPLDPPESTFIEGPIKPASTEAHTLVHDRPFGFRAPETVPSSLVEEPLLEGMKPMVTATEEGAPRGALSSRARWVLLGLGTILIATAGTFVGLHAFSGEPAAPDAGAATADLRARVTVRRDGAAADAGPGARAAAPDLAVRRDSSIAVPDLAQDPPRPKLKPGKKKKKKPGPRPPRKKRNPEDVDW